MSRVPLQPLQPEDVSSNGILHAMAADDLQRWLPLIDVLELPLGQVLYESGAAVRHIYFPATAIVSLLYVMEDGSSAEIAVVGREGVVGISLFMGGGSILSRAVVQSAGRAFRIRADRIRGDVANPAILPLLLRYIQALITQMSQTAVCNRRHMLD